MTYLPDNVYCAQREVVDNTISRPELNQPSFYTWQPKLKPVGLFFPRDGFQSIVGRRVPATTNASTFEPDKNGRQEQLIYCNYFCEFTIKKMETRWGLKPVVQQRLNVYNFETPHLLEPKPPYFQSLAFILCHTACALFKYARSRNVKPFSERVRIITVNDLIV